MALSATFTANFASFFDAVDKADTKLKDFGAGADKVGGRLTALGNSFSGVKLIQDATLMVKAVEDIGGASKLTEKELARLGTTTNEAVAKMKALGMDVPKSLQQIADQTKGASTATKDWAGSVTTLTSSFKTIAGAVGLGFSIKGVIDFGKAIIDDAGHIADLSTKLGISAEAVQRFGYAADQTGASMDTVGDAIGKMNVNLATGDKSTVAALDAIGLRFRDVRAMKPEDAFIAIAQAIQQIPDPMRRAQAAMELFGKRGPELLPAIEAGFVGIGNEATVMADKTVAAMDRYGDAMQTAEHNIKTATGELIVWWMENQKWTNYGHILASVTTSWLDVYDAIKGGQGAATRATLSLTTALGKVKDPLKGLGVEAKSTSGLLDDFALAQDGAEKQAATWATAEKKATDAAEAHRAKIADLAATLSGVGLTQKTKDLTEAVTLNAIQFGRASLNSQATVDAVHALAREGVALTPILLDIYLKHLDWAAAGTKVQVGIKGLLGDLPDYTQQLKNFMSVQFFDFKLPDFKTQIGTLFQDLPNLAPQFKQWGKQNIEDPMQESAAAAAQKMAGELAIVDTVFGALGRTGGTAWKTAMQFSEIAITGMIRYKGAITDADRETVAMQTTTAIATTAISLGLDYMIAQWQHYRSQVNAARSTIADLQGQITALGEVPVGGPIIANPNQNPYFNSTIEALQRQLKNLQTEQENARRAQEELNTAIQKYGLTFQDLDQGPVQAFSHLRDEFLHTANAFITNGYKVSSVVHGMRDDLNEVVRTALETRQKLPEAFAPFLVQLAKSGDLADDVKRKLLGIADPAPWHDMEEAANRYGISIDSLGKQFQQSKLTDTADALVKDWNLLVGHGADVNAVIGGMSGKVNDLVHDSLKFGVDIPANMRPMLQAMVDAGKLTDENGDKLTDLTKLHFSEDLAADFQKLIDKLDELIDKLGGDHPNSVAGAAATTAKDVERSFNDVKVNPIHVPYVFDAENPPDFDVNASGRAGVPHLARGGIVTRPTFALIGEAGPEAVVPLGAGGALAPTVIVNAQGAFFDTPDSLQRLANKVSDALTAKYSVMGKLRAAV